MELLQLKYFQTVARFQHITKAANELNISQPSLSIMISRLEEELGSPLFIRKGRNIELNEIGKAFLKRVNTIFCELESARLEINDIIGLKNKHISLATTNTRFLSGILKEFFLAHPEATIHQFINSNHVIEEHLKSGNIDFCITSPPIKSKEIECTILKEDEIVLVVPSTHRFAGKKSIILSEVANDPFIALAESYSYRGITDSLCSLSGFTPNVIFEVDDSLMYDILHLGRGIALIPKSICEMYSSDTLTFIRIEEPICNLTVGLSWLSNRYLSETAESFKKFVIGYYNK